MCRLILEEEKRRKRKKEGDRLFKLVRQGISNAKKPLGSQVGNISRRDCLSVVLYFNPVELPQ